MEVSLIKLLVIIFIGMCVVVGGYVYFFLKIMEVDPREKEFRAKHGDDYGLAPSLKHFEKDSNRQSKKPLDEKPLDKKL